MLRFTPRLGIVFAFLAGVFAVVAFSGTTAVSPAPFPVPLAASSSLSVLPGVTLPQNTTTTAIPAQKASIPTRAAAPAAKALSQASKSAMPAVAVPVSTPVHSPLLGNVPLDAAASALRSALVNIVCYSPIGSKVHSISGSGVFIDSKGIILTNAHVAQYFLLTADRGVSCTIRTGSPAVDTYKAALIYISPVWIRANATVLAQMAPSGTGEFDFALLAVTKSATAEALPSSFPSLPLSSSSVLSSTPVVIASYGAQFLETSQIQSSLFPTIVFGSIKEIFTFASSSIDVLALGGSVAAQEGSSGGGVADASGSLVGTITTSTVQGDTSTRSLSAISASYIRSEYAREMRSSLDALLSEPTAFAVTDFAPQIPALEAIITANL